MSLLLLFNGCKLPTITDTGGGGGGYAYDPYPAKQKELQQRIQKDDDEILEIIIQAFLME